MKSIRSFLVITVLSTFGVVTLVAMGWGYLESRHEVGELFDAQLAQFARILDNTVDIENTTAAVPVVISTRLPKLIEQQAEIDDDEATPQGHKYERKIAFQIWAGANQLIAHSSNTITTPFAPLTPGFSTRKSEKSLWRIFVLPRQNYDQWIIVAERDDIRNELSEKFALQAIIPVLLSSPILIFLIWFVIRSGLSPLRQITQQLERRKASDLQPIKIKPVPEELETLVSAINELFNRVENSFEREKQFTSNAAHELRTPLAAMKIQLENALIANEGNPAALKNVLTGLDRMNHIVEQLLLLARLGPDSQTQNYSALNLYAAARNVIADQADLALAKNQDISLVGDKDIELYTSATAVDIILRNLVTNAILYTQDHGKIIIEVDQDEKGSFLRVSDNGPGVPDAVKSRLFDRFYRVGQDSHASGAVGSGLGLTIVDQLIKIHNASISIENPQIGTGLVATVRFN